MKNILIIHAHPVQDSFVDKLSTAYVNGAIASGANVKELKLNELKFDLNFSEGYKGSQQPEPDIVRSQELIKWAEHIVFFYPNWWATFPALLKGFIDRTFLPGFAFQYNKNKAQPQQLLAGKSARLVVTMDSPVWYYYLFLGAPGHKAMRRGILNFCGIKPVSINSFGPMRTVSDSKRLKWISMMHSAGFKMK